MVRSTQDHSWSRGLTIQVRFIWPPLLLSFYNSLQVHLLTLGVLVQ